MNMASQKLKKNGLIYPYISLMEKQPQGGREKGTSPHVTLPLQTLPHVDTDLSFKYNFKYTGLFLQFTFIDAEIKR